MTRNRSTIAGAFALLTLFASLPAVAEAGTARASSGRPVYEAAAGEVNDVTARRVDRTHVDITDVVPITAGQGCRAITANRVRCTNRSTDQSGLVRLRDGDDRYTGPLFSEGGPGADVLVDTGRADPFLVAVGQAGGAFGGSGNDTITGNGFGGEDDDVLSSLPGRAAVLGGGPGNDRLNGGTADDFLNGGIGADHVASGGGRDTLSFSDQLQQPVVFSLQSGPAGGRAGEADTYEGTFANVTGDDGTNDLTGNELNNELSAEGGSFSTFAAARLTGLGGNDSLNGGRGADQLLGGDGGDHLSDGDLNGNTDTLDGGEGDDTIDAADAAEEDSATDEKEMDPTLDNIDCGAGKDRVNVDVADAPANCEIVAVRRPFGSSIFGTDADDVLDGFSGDGDEDRILGMDGDDTLRGATGDDTLFGQAGNDRLEGDGQDPRAWKPMFGGNDVLSGSDGADHLIGGYGNDRLTGGAGADRLSGGFGRDVIGARDGTRDKVVCGRDFDRVTADRNDRVASDCERVSRG